MLHNIWLDTEQDPGLLWTSSTWEFSDRTSNDNHDSLYSNSTIWRLLITWICYSQSFQGIITVLHQPSDGHQPTNCDEMIHLPFALMLLSSQNFFEVQLSTCPAILRRPRGRQLEKTAEKEVTGTLHYFFSTILRAMLYFYHCKSAPQ